MKLKNKCADVITSYMVYGSTSEKHSLGFERPGIPDMYIYMR